MSDPDTPTPAAEQSDPTAGWDERRRRYEALKTEQNRRGAELTKWRPPERPIVQGRHRMLKRSRR